MWPPEENGSHHGARWGRHRARRRQFGWRLLRPDASLGGFALCLTLRRFDWHVDELLFRGIQRAANPVNLALLQFWCKQADGF